VGSVKRTASPRQLTDRYPGIDQRPTGRYRVRVAHAGRRYSRSFTTLAAALAWRAKAMEALESGAEPQALATAPTARMVGRMPTVEHACRALGAGIEAGTVRNRSGGVYKPSVSRKYESMLRLYIVPRIGDVPLPSLGRRDVQSLVDVLAAEVNAETARKALTALRAALRVAQRNGLVEANVCSGVRVPSDEHEEQPARILTPAECVAIVAAAEAMDERLGRSLGGPLFGLAFGSGLRSGELLALEWGERGIDLDRARLRVRRSLDRSRGADGQPVFVAPKSRSSRRDVPLPPQEVARLRRHRMASGRPADGALVFVTAAGEPLNATGVVRYAWRKAVEASGVEEPFPKLHDARHAYATHALRAGLTMHAVARLLGHRDIALIARRYGHALPDELAEAGNMLERFRESWSA
jgi:integrase